MWHWYLNLKQKIKVRENKLNKISAKKVKSGVKNEGIVMKAAFTTVIHIQQFENSEYRKTSWG